MRTLHFKTVIIFLASILILISSISYASNIKPYFEATKISPELIDNPSLPGSKRYEKQVKYIIELQEEADMVEIDEAFDERHFTPEMVSQFVNTELERSKYPKLYKLLDRSYKTSKIVTKRAKNYFDLDRPYVSVEDIKPLIAAHANPSYPSGHTTESYVIARVLSMVFVKNKQDFLARAKEISEHRVLVGMHFPQDLDAGRQLSLLVMGGLIQNKNFLKDLKKAKKEIADIDK